MLKIHPFRISMLSKRDLHPLQAAANLTGEEMLDLANQGLTSNQGKYMAAKRNAKVVYSNLIVPGKDSPLEKELPDFLRLRKGARSELIRNAKNTLWLRVEWAEKRDDAQFGRLFTFAMPPTLSSKLAERTLELFAEQELVERGMVVDAAIHEVRRDGVPIKRNAYAMSTTRPFRNGDFQNKDRSWNDRSLLFTWRKNWFVLLQDALQEDQRNCEDPNKHSEWLSLCSDYINKPSSIPEFEGSSLPFQDLEEKEAPVKTGRPRL